MFFSVQSFHHTLVLLLLELSYQIFIVQCVFTIQFDIDPPHDENLTLRKIAKINIQLENVTIFTRPTLLKFVEWENTRHFTSFPANLSNESINHHTYYTVAENSRKLDDLVTHRIQHPNFRGNLIIIHTRTCKSLFYEMKHFKTEI